jgi:membrane-bound acyltransferase YfiQ involved in biofilm formation
MAKRLSLLMGIAVLTLPFYHAAAYGLSALFLWTNRYLPVPVPNYDQLGTVSFYATFVIRQLSAYGISIFLFVSGFFVALMAKGGPGGPTWGSVLTRARKLLVPWAVWTAISVLLLRRTPTVAEVLGLYYFLLLVAQYYLLSPVLVPWAKKWPAVLLIITAVIQYGLHSLRYLGDLGIGFPGLQNLLALTPIWFFPSRIFYFALGVVAGINLESFHGRLRRVKALLALVVVVSAVLMFVEHAALAAAFGKLWLGPTFSGVARNVYAVALLLLLLALDEVPIPFSDQLMSLGRKSLGVFLVNTPAVYVAASLMYHLAPWMLGMQVVYQGVLVALGLGVPLLAMWAVSRSPARRYYSYLFG